jgi:DNA-binding SARP family transcriptional activator
MATFQVRLFGRFGVWLDGSALNSLEASRAQELLGYLLIHRGRPQAREALADLLWGESAGESAKKALRQALWKLHSALDARNVQEAERVLLVDPGWVSINPRADLWVDVTIFEANAATVEGISGSAMDERTATFVREAVELYRGDLLVDWYEDWCLYERERLQNLYLLLLTKLLAYCETHEHYDEGLGYGLRVLQIDHAHEQTHRALMRIKYLSGDRTSALRQYRQCVRALEEELGVEPAVATTQVYEQIRADRLEQVEVVPHAHFSEQPELTSVRISLDQLELTLSDFQSQIRHLRHDIEQVERHA